MYQSSINTDYETQWPQGIKREYWLNVSAHTISPDGFLKTQGKVFNNTYPGPLIEACWGDDIVSHRFKILPYQSYRSVISDVAELCFFEDWSHFGFGES